MESILLINKKSYNFRTFEDLWNSWFFIIILIALGIILNSFITSILGILFLICKSIVLARIRNKCYIYEIIRNKNKIIIYYLLKDRMESFELSCNNFRIEKDLLWYTVTPIIFYLKFYDRDKIFLKQFLCGDWNLELYEKIKLIVDNKNYIN